MSQQPVPYYPQPMRPVKPGMITAVAILTLVDGILNLIGGLAWILSLIGAPIGIYSIVLGIMELVYVPRILADPVQEPRLRTHIGVMQIVNIISCQGLSLVTGILALVFNNNPQVQAYFAAVNGGQQPWQPVPPHPPTER